MGNLGNNFYNKLVQISSELNMKPEDILAVMVSESGINPSSVEKKYHGSGLIGFMPDTLHNLGYKGEWSDFIKLTGEDQLDYVKKYIKDRMQIQGGKPFKSAAEYYVANFWPAALKLPGIQQGNPDTIFIEEKPRTVKDKNGKLYSKKYYDIGIKIDPGSESGAYKANPLFHGSLPGAITYGDMMKQVDKNRQSSTYKQAINAMNAKTGYQPEQRSITPKSEKNDQSFFANFFSKLEQLLSRFASCNYINNRFLISVGSSSDYTSTMEYARILSTAIEEYLNGKVQICADRHNIEIECQINGDQKIIFDALKELSLGVSDAFCHATRDIGNIKCFALVTADLKSDHANLDPKLADLYCRKFKLNFVRLS